MGAFEVFGKDFTHAQAYAAREGQPREVQNQLAAEEHKLAAKELVRENPFMAAPLAVAIPLYQVAKVAGFTSSRSDPSLDQLTKPYSGILEGLSETKVTAAEAVIKTGEAFKDAASFFGKKFNTQVEETLTAAQNISKESIAGKIVTGALDFFGVDFKSKPKQEVHPSPVADPMDKVMKSLIKAESQGKHTDDKGNLTKSSAGALGITQVLPKVGAKPGYGVTPLRNQTEEEYIRFSKDYLGAMVKEFDGDYEKAVAAYNGGVGTVKTAITKYGDKWKEKVPQETRDYITKVLGKK